MDELAGDDDLYRAVLRAGGGPGDHQGVGIEGALFADDHGLFHVPAVAGKRLPIHRQGHGHVPGLQLPALPVAYVQLTVGRWIYADYETVRVGGPLQECVQEVLLGVLKIVAGADLQLVGGLRLLREGLLAVVGTGGVDDLQYGIGLIAGHQPIEMTVRILGL